MVNTYNIKWVKYVFCLLTVIPAVLEALVFDEMRGTHSVGRFNDIFQM